MPALSPPTWAEIERDLPAPEGPFTLRRSRLGYVWSIVDTRTDAVRGTSTEEADGWRRVDALNRAAS